LYNNQLCKEVNENVTERLSNVVALDAYRRADAADSQLIAPVIPIGEAPTSLEQIAADGDPVVNDIIDMKGLDGCSAFLADIEFVRHLRQRLARSQDPDTLV
jgi:hypothetical protein